MAKIEYVSKKFRADKIDLIERVNEVVTEWQQQSYSLTLRQVYYQLVSKNIIENNMRSYKNLGQLINDARLAGYIDWRAIEDRTRNLAGNNRWDDASQIIRASANQFKLDHWENQNYYVEVWVEKDALSNIVGRACNHLDIDYFVCRGYTSQSEMWSAAQRLINRQNQGKEIVLLHLGDHDPSGIDMSRDIRERLSMFEVHDINFKRIALNMQQVEAYDPPPNPAKITDSRAGKYIKEFGHDSWELDALTPNVISELIHSHVIKYRNMDTYERVLQREEMSREILIEVASNWSNLENHWEDIEQEFF